MALQGWLGLGRTGVVDRRTWRALGRARVPAPWAGLGRGVLIDTARQVMLLVAGGRTVRAIHVSTGAYGRTPRGRFAVYRKEVLSWSVPFSTWMPYASYFIGGFAMHAYPSVPTYAGLPRLRPRATGRGAGHLRLRVVRNAGLDQVKQAADQLSGSVGGTILALLPS